MKTDPRHGSRTSRAAARAGLLGVTAGSSLHVFTSVACGSGFLNDYIELFREGHFNSEVVPPPPRSQGGGGGWVHFMISWTQYLLQIYTPPVLAGFGSEAAGECEPCAGLKHPSLLGRTSKSEPSAKKGDAPPIAWSVSKLGLPLCGQPLGKKGRFRTIRSASWVGPPDQCVCAKGMS